MKQFMILAIAMTVILMVSCNKSDNEATGTGDAIIVAKQSGTNTVYAISLFAYTYSTFQSVSATSSANASKTYTLVANQGFKTNFYYQPIESEFTTTKPTISTFNFSAVFENGVTQQFQDVLTDKVLPIPTLEKCEYVISNPVLEIYHELALNWTAISDASSYSISIYDGQNLVFGSAELANTVKTFYVSATGGGWAVGFTPVSGKAYTVRLYAYLYEPNGGSFDVQALSYVEKSVVWGD